MVSLGRTSFLNLSQKWTGSYAVTEILDSSSLQL